MTPLEKACQVFWDEAGIGLRRWDETGDTIKGEIRVAMQKTLLALAECDFPDEAIDAAEEARIEAIDARLKHQAEVWANIGKPIPKNTRGAAAFTWMPPAFKALLRSIANEGKDNG